MFGKRKIGYAEYVDAEVQGAADQPTTQDDRQHTFRSWFGKGSADTVAEDGADSAGTDADGAQTGIGGSGAANAASSVGSGQPGSGPSGSGPPGSGPQETDPPESDDDEYDGDYEHELSADEIAAEPAAMTAQPAVRRPATAGPPARATASQVSGPIYSRPLINPRLRADPRVRVWITRTLICLIAFTAVTIWQNWRYGVTAAVICAAIDTLFKSKMTTITPTEARVTSAQRRTKSKLKVLQAAGYMSLTTRRIPGTKSIIDHVVIGPGGIFTLDSQRMDTRLPVRAIGGKLFHGPNMQEDKLDHARYEAERAAELIGAELGRRVRVRPAMVIYGPSVPWVVTRLKGVDVFDGKHVSTYFRRRTKEAAAHRLDEAHITRLYTAAAHALPPL
jgi:hypothetical protein